MGEETRGERRERMAETAARKRRHRAKTTPATAREINDRWRDLRREHDRWLARHGAGRRLSEHWTPSLGGKGR